MGHHHHHSEVNSKGKLFATMLLNFLITIVEILGGIYSGSLSLISDAIHNFSDGISIIISYFAIKIAGLPKNEKYTFGYKRAEIFAALINSTVLIIISFFLIKEAIEKFSNPSTISGDIMILVASIGLISNVIGTFLLKEGAKSSINIKSTYLHLLSDALSSVGVIIGGVLILVFDIYWVDPILTILISLYILYESYDIVKEAVNIFMMASPQTNNIEDIVKSIKLIHGIRGVHHVHYWQLSDDQTHLEAHIEADDNKLSELDSVRKEIEELLHHDFDIEHITLQFEFVKCE